MQEHLVNNLSLHILKAVCITSNMNCIEIKVKGLEFMLGDLALLFVRSKALKLYERKHCRKWLLCFSVCKMEK